MEARKRALPRHIASPRVEGGQAWLTSSPHDARRRPISSGGRRGRALDADHFCGLCAASKC